MAKQGMKRPARTHTKAKNNAPVVPELQGKAKQHGDKTHPIIAGTAAPAQKGIHSEPFAEETPISDVYPAIDNDLARDNLENDIPEIDR